MVDTNECSPERKRATARPNPSSISPETWWRFESITLAVVHRIQPTANSEYFRAAIIDYVQRLIRFHTGCQVFPFGSVPLKTYLPDGDIDLTTSGSVGSDENLACEIHYILLSEEERKDSEFEVKDVQLINAQVKLVKCLVQNISVDISFNQIGGLCTLCFLEKVDQNFGKDHLFKRSIMLIKNWCYYESRILGAQHGLISTYALETLVLYIFHTFHKFLDGPLAVLYRFLDYYSKFDWDNKGISLFGPVSLASLPELVTDLSDTHDDGFLSREEFLKECVETFSVPPKNSEKNTRVFSQKFLNIIDPLKQNNNLGRSVSKGNFYRIRSAFDLGARKLGKILQLSSCSTVNEVVQFFRNTLKRNHTRFRPDALVSSFGDDLRTGHFVNYSVSGSLDMERVGQHNSPLYNDSCGDMSGQFNNINILDSSNHDLIKKNGHNSVAENVDQKVVSRKLLNSDAPSYVSSGSSSMRNGGGFREASMTCETCVLPYERHHCALHLSYHSEKKADASDKTNLSNHGMPTKWVSARSHHSFEDAKYTDGFSRSSPLLFGHQAYSSANLVDDLEKYNSVYTYENSEPGGTTNDIVSDLSGDFDSNFNNLLYAQGCQQDNPTNQFYYQMMPPPPAQYWDTHPSLGPGSKNPYEYAGTNEAVFSPPHSPGYFVMRPFHQIDDHTAMIMRAHGTGTYLPNPNMHEAWLDDGCWTSSPSFQIQRHFHGNGFMVPQDINLDFGTLGALPLEVTSTEHASRSDSASNNQVSRRASSISASKKAGRGCNRARNHQPYHLKDSGDFPPLSS